MYNKARSILKLLLVVFLNIFFILLFLYINDKNFGFSFDASGGSEYVEVLSRRGSTGSEVRSIQEKLKALGHYKGNVDGIYGAQTEAAVKAYQKAKGLAVDGIAGPKTLSALGISNSSSTAAASSGDEALLARMISAEARGETYVGQVAVGAVILNRIKHPSFPNTMSGVIYEPGAFTAITDGQFNQPVAESAVRAAKDAMNGWDPSGGAIYYYNPAKTSNRWMLSRPVITTIGKHKFCR